MAKSPSPCGLSTDSDPPLMRISPTFSPERKPSLMNLDSWNANGKRQLPKEALGVSQFPNKLRVITNQRVVRTEPLAEAKVKREHKRVVKKEPSVETRPRI